MTEHEYDERGRLARSVTTVEAEWTPHEVGLMQALAAWEEGQCGRCGGRTEETTAIEHDFNNPHATAVYLPAPGFPRQCHSCAALERSEQQTAAQKPQFPGAMNYAVHLVPRG